MRFKLSKYEFWRTKREGSWKLVDAFWGEVHWVGKHMSGESFVNIFGKFIESIFHGRD